jgi:hypothetical protein
MRLVHNPAVSFLLALLVGSAAMPALADDACAGFKWDVSKERALFAGCSAPHKIVEFELEGAQPFVVQFSGATADSVRLTITPSPTQKP